MSDKDLTVKRSDGSSENFVRKELPANTTIYDMMKMDGCILNLMPAIAFNEATGKFEFPVECTIGGNHPHAYFSCSAREFRENPECKKKWIKAQNELTTLFNKREAEAKAAIEAGIDPAKIRND